MTKKRAHGDGGIEPRGENSWRLRYRSNGKRFTVTFHGTKGEALKELRRLIKAGEDGEHVDPSKITLADFLDRWERDWAVGNVSAKTLETYIHHLKHVRRHIGSAALQKLQPVNFAELYSRLLRDEGEEDGLAPRTVGHIHRIVHRALGHAVQWGLLRQNPTDVVDPPRVADTEIEILQPDDLQAILKKLQGRSIYPIAMLAIATGMRRGELLALRWKDIDMDGARLRVERSVEQTKSGLAFKSPKTKHGRRTISLPTSTVADLRAHWRTQLEQRIALGRGKSLPDDLVFPTWDGATRSPNALTKEWSTLMEGLGLAATFHSLRHTHASQLIASGLDVITISRRLGHGSPSITLGVYGHLFPNTDDRAAEIMEASFLKGRE
jgi:integrase